MKRILFVNDPGDETAEDIKLIISQLDDIGVKLDPKRIIHKERLHDALDESFDILFFDWGGISFGNSMLQRQCDVLNSHAQEHPDRTYIMASQITGWAMRDAMNQYSERQLPNVIINIEEQAEMVRAAFI